MNDEQRKALVDRLGKRINDVVKLSVRNNSYIAGVMASEFEKILADRATMVAEPDAEAVAKAMFQSLRPIWGDDIPAEEIPEGDDPDQYYEYSISWEQWNKYGYGLDYDSLSEMRADSIRKLARAAIAAMPSRKDDNWLDDALDSLDKGATLEIFNDENGFDVQVYYGELFSSGTGTTRREAILDAVKKAKEAE